MAQFKLFLSQVVALLWLLCISANAIEIKGQLPPIPELQRFIAFMTPYLQGVIEISTQERSVPRIKSYRRSATTVEGAISDRIAELKNLLEDEGDTLNDDSLNTEYDITNIVSPNIERQRQTEGKQIPVQKFGKRLKKYRLKRDKIKKLLHDQKVSNETKALVMSTLDNVLELLDNNECRWKSEKTDRALGVSDDGFLGSGSDHDINLWNGLMKRYNGTFRRDDSQSNLKKFFNGTNYSIRCEFTKTDKKKLHRKNKVLRGEDKICPTFKLCSDELMDFMTDFYKRLNDTTVSAINNYAAMYAKDVRMYNDYDKDDVVASIKKVGDVVEHKVIKSFIKQLKTLTVDENKNKSANIEYLTTYVVSTVTDIKKYVKKRIEKELKMLRSENYFKVKEDLNENIDAELSNVEKMFKETICNHFMKCNGRYSRSTGGQELGEMNKDVFVQVQLAIDEDSNLTNTMNARKTPMRRHNAQGMNTYNNIRITRTTSFNSIISVITINDTKLNKV